MTREEYHAHKAQQERRRQIERRGYEAAKGPLDLPLLLLTLLLTGMGLLMLFSASFPSAYYESGDPAYYLKRQALFAALGLAATMPRAGWARRPSRSSPRRLRSSPSSCSSPTVSPKSATKCRRCALASSRTRRCWV